MYNEEWSLVRVWRLCFLNNSKSIYWIHVDGENLIISFTTSIIGHQYKKLETNFKFKVKSGDSSLEPSIFSCSEFFDKCLENIQ